MQTAEYRPQLFSTDADISRLRHEYPHLRVVDTFERQLRELFLIRHKQFISRSKEEAFASDDFRKFQSEQVAAYSYVYYPWNGTVVKCVKAEDYFALRTDRNQDLITAKEQVTLSLYRVAVLGMSVGSNIAFVLTQAGISQEIVLADPDVLDTTNLNRIFAGVHEIGLNKAVLAARRIYEGNPYAKVSLMPAGVTEENLSELLGGKGVDCIVDEIDDIALKIKLRLLAIKHRIPVVMVTDNGDGVVLHVERFDLGHDKIFGKTIEYFSSRLEGAMTKEKVGATIIFDIVGGVEKVDPKMMASVERVLRHDLVSWSQLGSAAVLGAVMVTIAIKQIALGESVAKDIRAFVAPFRVEVSTHGS